MLHKKAEGDKRRIIQVLGVLPILLVLLDVFAVISPEFATFDNMMNIFRMVSINMTRASGMTMVILTGGIDLSVGSIMAVSGVVAMKLVVERANPAAAVPVALVVGLLAGIVNGTLAGVIKVPPFIATLGSMTFLRGAAFLLCGGHSIIASERQLSFAWVGDGSLGPVPWLVVIAVGVLAVAWFLLKRTTFGMRIYAVGGNEQAAGLTGIRVWAVLIGVYALSGLCSAIAGIMMSARLFSANGLLGQGYELDAIAATILGGTSFTGGKGSVVGTLFGVLIIGVLNNGLMLTGVPYFWQLVAKGVVIILAVIIDIVRNKLNR